MRVSSYPYRFYIISEAKESVKRALLGLEELKAYTHELQQQDIGENILEECRRQVNQVEGLLESRSIR
jgi:hypothetical protein